MKSVEIANNLFKTNTYQTMKQLENEKKEIESELKNRMKDEKRIVNHTTGVVMKFINYNKYEIKTKELNELLYSYGLLNKTVKFDTKKLTNSTLLKISQFENPLEYYAKINVRLPKQEFNFQNVETKELTKKWNTIYNQYKILSNQYESARKEINTCEELIKKGKLKFNNGSISRIAKEQTYNIEKIQQEYGADFIINNATPLITKINSFIDEGYISPSEIEQFKTSISINIKFLVMTLEEESKLINHLTRKNSKASIIRENIARQNSKDAI